MSDHYGALEFPVQIPSKDDAVQDPALDKIGAYLMACLNDQLNPSWKAVAPGKKFVQSYITNLPVDKFNERDLPTLFLSRTSSIDEQVTDDWTESSTDITVTWVPHTADLERRVLRSTVFNGLTKVISRAFRLGRSPAWIDPSDSDPTAASLGSVLITRAGLFRWPQVIGSRPDNATVFKGSDAINTYPAFTVMIRINEITQWDNSFDSITMNDRAPTKLDETVTSGEFSISKLIPTT